VRTLDQGAEVRTCVEHGAPIGVTKERIVHEVGDRGSGPCSAKPDPFQV
jgi:hypothetical protein